jgi:cell division protein FtsQ
LVRKRVRKNYYKNSLARKKERIVRRCVLFLKLWFVAVAMGGTSLLFILGHDALTQSAYFEAQTISVEGNHRLSKRTILEQAGVTLHDNILAMNLRLLRQRLLADPWICAAEVERKLPDSIHIRVRERAPVAILKLNRLFYLDETGQVFKSVEPSDQVRVPVVTGLKVSDIDLNGQGHSPVFKAMMEVLHLSRLHGSILPLDAIHNIHADPEMGLTLCGFEKGLAIKLGFDEYESKFNRLRDMMSYFRRGDELLDIECIDLNDLERVVVRPAGGVSLLGVCYRKEI